MTAAPVGHDLYATRGMVGMEIAVVYESMFGATHEVAEAIAEGVAEARPDATVTCLRVGDADPERVARADLVVVGGPTHMRGMSSGMTRKMAVSMEEKKENGGHVGHGLEPDAAGAGLRDWFHTLPKAPKGKPAAAFDTRGEGAMMGGAAKGIAHRLEGHGYELVAGPEGFLIEGEDQLLRDGERARARAWAAGLLRTTAGSTTGR
jgi:Flavodoxin